MPSLILVSVCLLVTGLAATVSLWHVRRATAAAERAAGRERCLLAASQQLAEASDHTEVDQVVARTAHDLLGQAGAASVVWEEQGEDWRAIASAGAARVARVPSVRLPAFMLDRMEVGEPWQLGVEEAAELQRSLGLGPDFRGFVYVPLPRREGPRAVLALSCLQDPDPELPDALRRFAQEVATAEDRARLQAEVAEREARLRSVLQGSSDIIGLLDDEGTITFVNGSTEPLHGYRPEDLIGTNVFDLFHPDDRQPVLQATLAGDLVAGVQVAHRMFDAWGGLRHVETMVSRPVGSGSGYVLNVRDVTERRRLEAEILHHANHDALTGLQNRRAFTARLDEALARYARTGVPVGLIMLDLDDFKPVNDTFGHQAGDEALVEVARRLTDGVRTTDVAARMGGDEFAVILENASDADEVGALAHRLEQSLCAPIRLERGAECRITASMGMATSWEGCDGDSLLREADQHLYVQKRGRHPQSVPAARA